jgi:hypothetical protein
MKLRKIGAAKAVTIAVLFLVTVVAVLLVFTYFTGFLKIGSTSHESVSASGTFVIQTNGLSGVIAVMIENTGTSSIVSVAFACPTSHFSSTDCDGLTAMYLGAPVSSQNPLPSKGTAGGTATVQAAPNTAFSSGTLYSVLFTPTFSDGTTGTAQTITLSQG